MKITLTSLLFLICCSSFAQDYYKMRWGKIPQADLEMTTYEKDATASAVVLGDNCVIRFDFTDETKIIISRHVRIKILDEKGFDEANINIPFYSKGNYERINKTDAQIFSPQGEKTKLKKKDFFIEQENKLWSSKKFTFPKVEKGCVIEYRYDLQSKDIGNLTNFYFQNFIPTRWSRLQIEIPKALTYIPMVKGGLLDIRETERRIGNYGMNMKGDVNYSIYGAKDLPAVESEPFIGSLNDYRLRIFFQFKSFIIPGQVYQDNDNTWPSYAASLRNSKSFGEQYTNSKRFKDLAAAFESVKPATDDPTQLAMEILLFIKKRIRWNGYRGEYVSSKDLDAAFEAGEGNVAAINLAILALLRHHGIDASPAILSTRSNGAAIIGFPQRSQFDYVIVCATINGKNLFLDGSNPFCPFGTISSKAMNNYAFLITDGSHSWINLPNFKSSSIKNFNLELDETGTLTGTVQERYTKNASIERRKVAYNEGKKEYTKVFYQEDYPEIKIDSIDLGDKATIFAQPIMEHKTTFSLPNFAQKSGEFLYINPLLNEGFSENPFKAEKRQLPISFPYIFKYMNIVEITIPEGYKVEELPKNTKIAMQDGGGSYKYIITQSGNQIKCISTFNISKNLFPVESYNILQQIYDLAIEKQNEQIVLKKIAE